MGRSQRRDGEVGERGELVTRVVEQDEQSTVGMILGRRCVGI